MNHVGVGVLEISGFSVFTGAGATKPKKFALEKRSLDDICTMWPGRFVFVVLCVARGVFAFVLQFQSVGLFLWSNYFSESRAPSMHNSLYYS